MGTHISGKLGNVYSNALIITDCETAWDDLTPDNGNVTETAATDYFKVGAKSAKFAVGDGAGSDELLATLDIDKDLAAYDGVYWWARSSVISAAGGLQLLLDIVEDCGGDPQETLNFPALAANIWKQCFAKLADPADDIISIGLHYLTDIGAVDIWIDDVQALKEVDGIKSWTLDYTADTLETTDFESAGVKDYIIGGSGWSGSFEGYKDGVPLSIGAEVYLVLGESTTAYQNWIGKVIITACHPNVSHDGVVTYSYDFQGTGSLENPSA